MQPGRYRTFRNGERRHENLLCDVFGIGMTPGKAQPQAKNARVVLAEDMPSIGMADFQLTMP